MTSFLASPALRVPFVSDRWSLLEMNSPTPFSSSNDPTDFPEIDEPDSQPQREGLPAGFRMRASAHYVDQLETPPGPTLRAVATSTIEADGLSDAPEHLVNSIRKHGVVEPLLVQLDPRGRQYRLIAGRRRLAAARAAGLREVLCIVHAVTDIEAAALRDAAREVRQSALPPPPVDLGWMYPAQRGVEAALNTIESCTPLLNQPSQTARRGALQVIAVECRRAQRVIKAMKALGDGVPLRRASLQPGDLFRPLVESFRDEQRLLGTEPVIQISTDSLAFYGDDDLLLTAMASALAALSAAAGDRPRDVLFAAAGDGQGAIVLELTDRSLVLSDAFIRTAFSSPWPVPDGDAVLMLLQAARRIAAAHKGSMTLLNDAAGTTVRFQLPVDLSARAAIPEPPTVTEPAARTRRRP
jgi:hypothetical protein